MKSLSFPTPRPWLAGLGLLLTSPLAASAQTFYSNGATVFVNTGGQFQVNGAVQQAGTARLTTTGTAIVTGDVTSAAASTLDLSTGTLSVAGNVAQAGTTTGTTGTLRLSGAAAQSLGLSGGTVPNLTVDKASGTATLANAMQVRRVLTLANAGNLDLAGNGLTLLSDASGSALAVNSGTGVVLGTATVQRYIDGSLNSGPGYRHYSAPVSNTTVSDLATAGFTPVLTQSYNTSATPGTTTPFPNVFGYDQTRLITAANSNYAPFDRGFYVPQSTDPLTPGMGYAVNINAGQLVDFQGTLGNSALTVSLARNAGATAQDAGWTLVGNPYPAPLDWSQVAPADRQNLDAAVYVVQSTGQYVGGYRSYVNGQSTTGTNNPLLATAQGFFVRVSPGQTSGSLTFRNAQRVTNYATAQQTTFQRGTTDPRPVLRLTLAGAGLADGWVAYAEAGATPGFDKEYDAAKLPNGHGLNVSSAGSSPLAIDGQPAFTLATVLPLAVGVPTAGTYAFTTSVLANLPGGLTAYLRDAQTGTTTALAAGQTYSFTVTATQAQALQLGRFTVQFAPAAPLSATSAALAAAVSVYPNPASTYATVAVPGLRGATAVRVELLDAVGRVVLRQQAALPASGTQLVLSTAELATGVYVVRLQAGELLVTKRLTIE